MTTTTTTPARKLIDVEKILAVLDSEKHLIHGELVEPIDDEGHDLAYSQTRATEPGPLAAAHCEHVGRCALGSLLFATGQITYAELNETPGGASEWEFETVKLLHDAYGLARSHASTIIDANDSLPKGTPGQRRAAVKRTVRSLAENQINAPRRDWTACADETQSAAEREQLGPCPEPLTDDEDF